MLFRNQSQPTTMQNEYLVEKIIQACKRRLPHVSEYYILANLPRLNEEQSRQMEKLLKLGERDLVLSFLLDEVDHIVGHELGLINADAIREQQRRLQQAIDKTWMDIQVVELQAGMEQPSVEEEKIKELKSCLPTNLLKRVNKKSASRLKRAQIDLQKAGFYNGPIDGDYNSLTQEAFNNLKQEMRQQYYSSGEQYCSTASAQDRELLQCIVSQQNQDNTTDPQVNDLLSLEIWKTCEYHS